MQQLQHVKRPCARLCVCHRNRALSVCRAKQGRRPSSQNVEGSMKDQELPQGPSADDKTVEAAAHAEAASSELAPLSREERTREQRLASAARAKELGLSHRALKAKIKELLQLLPALTQSKLLALDAKDLQDLISDTAPTADRLARSGPLMGAPEAGQQQGEVVHRRKRKQPALLSSRRWDSVSSSSPVASLLGHTEGVTSVAITPDGRHAVSGSWDMTLRVWDLQSYTCVATLRRHSDGVSSLAISPDGRSVVSASYDGVLWLWDLRTRSCIATSHDDDDHIPITTVAISPDGRRVVSSGFFNELRVWDLKSLHCIAILGQGSSSGCRVVAITPDGRHAVSGRYDNTASVGGTVEVWNLRRYACTEMLGFHTSVISVATSPDGRHAFTGSPDGTLRVWDLQHRTCIASLKGYTKGIPAIADGAATVAITPDGRHAVSGSFDSTLRVWDLQQQACVATLRGHTSSVEAVAITPDGRHAIACHDNLLHVWDLQPHTGSYTPPPLHHETTYDWSAAGRGCSDTSCWASCQVQLTSRARAVGGRGRLEAEFSRIGGAVSGVSSPWGSLGNSSHIGILCKLVGGLISS